MKRLMMLLVCLALIVPSVGCCSHGLGYGAGYGGGGCNGGGCPGGACGSGPYGYSPQYPAGAYLGGTAATAGLTPYTPYAYGQTYPTTAAINPLPTY